VCVHGESAVAHRLCDDGKRFISSQVIDEVEGGSLSGRLLDRHEAMSFERDFGHGDRRVARTGREPGDHADRTGGLYSLRYLLW
jgi:hypothetical protein|tara:strand:- start:1765 stop:2016 length:252 start_codon:yes stop_codon:yes gene_type:complete